MLGLNRGVVVGLWVATAVVAFAIGWALMPPRTTPAPEDLGAEIRAALAEGDLLERFDRAANALQHLDPDNLPGVVAVYDQMIAILREGDIRVFIAAWARFDPLAALDHARGWPFRPKQEVGVEAAIHSWAQRDPVAARRATEDVGKGQSHLSEKLLHGLVGGWVHAGADGLDLYLADLAPTTRDVLLVVALATLMRSGGAEAAMPWVDGVLRNEAFDGKFKLSTFRRGVRSVARWYPERGAAWVTEHAGHAYAVDGPRMIAEQWGRSDGRAAMQWMRDQPAGKPRDQGVRQTFVEWLRSDPQGAREWLNSETLTAFHDPALELYASRIDHRQPEEAIGWCERIVDLERRTGCFRATARTWYQWDAAAAEEWLQLSPLDEETRIQVRVQAEMREQSRGKKRRRPAGGPSDRNAPPDPNDLPDPDDSL